MNSPEPFDDLEAELVALGDLLDVPSPPPADVAAAVRARLEPTSAPDAELGGGPDPAHGPFTAPVRPHPRAPGRRARWKIVTAVVIAVIAITAATPQGRAAVVQILRFAGIEIQIGDTPPKAITTTAPMPGERTVPPSDVTGSVKFQVKTLSRLGSPRSVTVADNGRVVSMFWPGGIRLDQFDGGLDPVFFKKLGPPWPDYVKVGAYNAWWLPGEHPLGYIRRQDGTEVPLRQAGPTLIWQQDTMSYRLEGVKTREEAIRIATSLQ
ncbi:hypothetical protein ACFLIM_38140 [Nonomuraea sp. M3C6]|uniref:DUF4367 domain-containing protein n=1 Tax=Nonomuraea marmarensis TaxID=3351344 RepID=A0ABW7ASI0_9ACTN